ncbi:MAG: hypothetical protein DRR19_11150 [Candidatus Parabeggiatoa sp. nov. 1]|nr:MAG: hypothetical protein DRR19_11150 [Gammaproteobacteria bacterium]
MRIGMKTNVLRGNLIFVLFMLLACSVSEVAAINNFYLLDVSWLNSSPEASAQEAKARMLLVSMPKAAPGFDTPALIYTRGENEISHYSESRWVDTPARMFLPLLVLHLEATGKFKAVLSAATSSIACELRLDTEIVRLQQEFMEEPSQVRLVLRAQLLDMDARQVVATKVFEIKTNAPQENAKGGVLATNDAFKRVLADLKTFVEEQL